MCCGGQALERDIANFDKEKGTRTKSAAAKLKAAKAALEQAKAALKAAEAALVAAAAEGEAAEKERMEVQEQIASAGSTLTGIFPERLTVSSVRAESKIQADNGMVKCVYGIIIRKMYSGLPLRVRPLSLLDHCCSWQPQRSTRASQFQPATLVQHRQCEIVQRLMAASAATRSTGGGGRGTSEGGGGGDRGGGGRGTGAGRTAGGGRRRRRRH